MMPERRLLDFTSMDEIMPDVECLIEGHTIMGHWTLAQILHHLATSIRLTSLARAGSPSQGGSDEFRRRFFASGVFPMAWKPLIAGSSRLMMPMFASRR